jgi:hypothetical protein
VYFAVVPVRELHGLPEIHDLLWGRLNVLADEFFMLIGDLEIGCEALNEVPS